jgi:hypothetical protein
VAAARTVIGGSPALTGCDVTTRLAKWQYAYAFESLGRWPSQDIALGHENVAGRVGMDYASASVDEEHAGVEAVERIGHCCGEARIEIVAHQIAIT